MAEVILAESAMRMGLGDRFYFASKGLMDWNLGHGADGRAMEIVAQHGLDLRGHLASQLRAGEIGDWDWFVAMDRGHRIGLIDLGAPEQRVLMMRQFESASATPPDVPDPYGGERDGFEQVFSMIHGNAEALINDLLLRDRDMSEDRSRTV